jgi:Xaa-Pro aminopeptidase
MYVSRISALQDLITEHKLHAILVTSVPNIIYFTGYAGFSIEEREAFLFITPEKAYILTDGRYVTAIQTAVPHLELIEISSRHTFKKAFAQLIEEHRIKKLGIEENHLFVYEYKTILPFVKETMHVPVSTLRIKKTPEEIALLEKACLIGDQAVSATLPALQTGMSEKHIASTLENHIRKTGAEPSFRTIIAFNANAAIPHHQTSSDRLTSPGLILIDSGAKNDNYCSDMTRTVFLGKATDVQKKMYQTVHDAQAKAAEKLASLLGEYNLGKIEKVNASDIDHVAREYILSQGYPTIPHSLGHGIGLEVHEAPTLSPVSQHTLENGMVFSIEPGIYLPHEAGVRIEDLYVIENNMLRQLTHSPKHLIEL